MIAAFMTNPKYTTGLIVACLSLFSGEPLTAQNGKPESTKYEKYIDEQSEVHLKEYIELVSIPGISTMPSHRPDIENTATWIANKMKMVGLTTVRIIPTKGLPVVYGCWDKAPGKPTVLIYSHYDVQPVKEAEWDNPPFVPKMENGKIYGRGASDDKSGVMIPLWAVETMLHIDKSLPVNVKFVIEGEEENGSLNFHEFLAENKDLLKADYALNTDATQRFDSVPSIVVSVRGIALLEFHVKTANIDAHSGFGGKTPNSAKAMAEILGSFYNKDGSVAVEGFYDKVLPLTDREKVMIKKLDYSKADDMKILGTTAETGDTNYLPLERTWYRPTLEINGMQSGYTAAEGFSTIIPGSAMARISCRLVNNQSGKEIIDLIVKHINKYCPVGATVTFKRMENYVSPIRFLSDTKAYNSVSDALAKIYGKAPLQIGMGGSVGPLIDFKEQLGLYAYSLGFQHRDEHAHASNEFFRLANFRKGQLVYCYYLQHLTL